MSGLLRNTYYIDSGQKNKLYTLRKNTIYSFINSDGSSSLEEQDYYVITLCADSKKAIKKAQDYLAKYYTDPDKRPKLNIAYAYDKLDAIRHRTKEAIEAERLRIEEEREQALSEYKQEQMQKTLMLLEKAQSGIMPFGMHSDKKFNEIPLSYIQWFLSNHKKALDDGFEHQDPHNYKLHAEIYKALEPLNVLPESSGKYFGEVGEKYDFNGKVVSLRSFESQWGMVQIVDIVIDSGELIVYKGDVLHKQLDWEIEEGDEISFSAQVKEHSEWNDIKKSRVVRPKLIN